MKISKSSTELPELGWRGWTAVIGVGCVFTGGVFAVAGMTLSTSQAVLGLGGVVVMFVGVRLLLVRLRRAVPVSRFPSVERRAGIQFVGQEFEQRARWADNVPESVQPAVQLDIRDSLRALAREFLPDDGTTVDNPDDGTSVDARIAAGTWTDDRVAAAFLQNEESSLQFRRVSFADQVRRTVDALAAAALGETRKRTWYEETTVETNWTPGRHTTSHWLGLGALALFVFAAAALLQTSALVVVAATLLGVVGYVQLSRLPPLSLAVERTVDTENPYPGEAVTVSVTVTNESSSVLSDLRLVDDVPDRLAVVSGSARHATALAPNESTTFEYEVRTVYGEHRFDAIYVALRDPSGYRERTETYPTATQTLRCEPGVVKETVPLHPQTTGVTGHVPSNTGGSGQEFRSVRAYRRGDPLRRVDWKRLARTGEIATIELREEHAATVVLLVDAREGAFCVASRGELTALDRSLAGASQLFTTLAADGDRVGLASIAPEWRWIAPGSGAAHRTRIRDALAGETFEPQPEWHGFVSATYVRELRSRLPADAQLLVLSPLLDGDAVDVIKRLRAHGHPVTVFSPDPTGTETVGGTVAHLERRLQLETLQHGGIRVIDWSADESLARAVSRAERGWQT